VGREPPRLREGRVRELEHADRARRRLIERERIPGEPPAPVRPRYRIAGALDLGERAQQLGGDDGGRMLAEERAVVPPCLGRRLGQPAVHREEELRVLLVTVLTPSP